MTRRSWHSRDDVLPMWERYVRRGWKAQEIADELEMDRRALLQAVLRARRAGDPRAIYRFGPQRKVNKIMIVDEEELLRRVASLGRGDVIRWKKPQRGRIVVACRGTVEWVDGQTVAVKYLVSSRYIQEKIHKIQAQWIIWS